MWTQFCELRVLKETKGMIGGSGGAAEKLGLKRTALNSKLRKLGIERSDPVGEPKSKSVGSWVYAGLRSDGKHGTMAAADHLERYTGFEVVEPSAKFCEPPPQ